MWREIVPGTLSSEADNLMILPRKGEVAPKVTEGEDTGRGFALTSPLRLAIASHLPLAGEDQTSAG